MRNLLFKHWLLSEMADYGFGRDQINKVKGGTESIDGDLIFKTLKGNEIIDELARSPVGPNEAVKRWNNQVEWGIGPGAIQVNITPLGSMRVVVRRQIKDLKGEATWICEKVINLSDNKSPGKELAIAQNVYGSVNEIANEMMPGPVKEFGELDRLAWKLWAVAKREHPSYCMFPVSFRKQNENCYKLVFEFRGHGVQRQGSKPGRAEQYNIDVIWDDGKGLIRCMGYEIDSDLRQHTWSIQPSDFNELFSVNQGNEKIIESIIKTFLQY